MLDEGKRTRPKAAAGLRAELDRRYGDDAKALLDQLDTLRASDNEKIRLDAVKHAYGGTGLQAGKGCLVGP